MKKFSLLGLLLIIVGVVIVVNLTGCNTGTLPGNGNEPIDPIDPIDPAFWFEEIHEGLIARIGNIRVDDNGIFLDDTTGIDMGQIATCQYVCNAINAKWGAGTVTPATGVASQMANCEYLLKMIDRANKILLLMEQVVPLPNNWWIRLLLILRYRSCGNLLVVL
jgi:hypothetical protein